MAKARPKSSEKKVADDPPATIPDVALTVTAIDDIPLPPDHPGSEIDITAAAPYTLAHATLFTNGDPPVLVLFQINAGPLNVVTDIQLIDAGTNKYKANFSLTVDDCPDPDTVYLLTVFVWDDAGAPSKRPKRFKRSSAT